MGTERRVRSVEDPEELLPNLQRARPPPSAFSELTRPVLCGFLFPAVGGMLYGMRRPALHRESRRMNIDGGRLNCPCAATGYDIGATSGAVSETQVLAEFDVGVDDAWVVGALTSASLYGAVAASALLFFIGDDIGRKFEMIAAAVLYVWPHHPAQQRRRPSPNPSPQTQRGM